MHYIRQATFNISSCAVNQATVQSTAVIHSSASEEFICTVKIKCKVPESAHIRKNGQAWALGRDAAVCFAGEANLII